MSWQALRDAGELARAIDELRAAVRSSRAARDHTTLAVLLLSAARFEEALLEAHRAAGREGADEALLAQIEIVAAAERAREGRRERGAGASRSWLPAPTEVAVLFERACEAAAAGDRDGARALVRAARQATAPQPGTLVTRAGTTLSFEHIADVDELTGPCFELVTDRLVDVPFAHVARVTFERRQGALDDLFLPVCIDLHEGARVTGRLPLLYPGTSRTKPGPVCLGRDTELVDEGGYSVGRGRRDFRLTARGGRGALVAADSVESLTLEPREPIAPRPAAKPPTPAPAARHPAAAAPAAPAPSPPAKPPHDDDELPETWRPKPS